MNANAFTWVLLAFPIYLFKEGKLPGYLGLAK